MRGGTGSNFPEPFPSARPLRVGNDSHNGVLASPGGFPAVALLTDHKARRGKFCDRRGGVLQCELSLEGDEALHPGAGANGVETSRLRTSQRDRLGSSHHCPESVTVQERNTRQGRSLVMHL